MKKSILLYAVIVLGAMPVLAQEGERTGIGETGGKGYIVKKGDTLWGLSAEFLNDPFKWPNIWEHNPGIKNPNRIYPGEKIIWLPLAEEESAPPLPPAQENVEATAEIAGPEEVEHVPAPAMEDNGTETASAEPSSPAPSKETFSYPGIERAGFVVSDGVTPFGTIIDSREDRTMISLGDEVYINAGEDKGAKEGERYAVYRKTAAIYHPLTRKPVGHQVDILGVVEIKKVHEKLSEGVITASYDAISNGDGIAKVEPMPSGIEIKRGQVPVEGIILSNRESAVEIATGDIVFLDRGRGAGVEVGNTLLVYIPGRVLKELETPPENIGKVLVISIQDDTATALVISSKRPLHAGDRIKMENGF